jgi:hypothetical protein
MEACFDEAAEERRGGCSIEAVIVIQDSHPHFEK